MVFKEYEMFQNTEKYNETLHLSPGFSMLDPLIKLIQSAERPRGINFIL